MKRIMMTLVDEGSFFEIGKDWGTSIIGGLARLDGVAVAIYAENPMMYGGVGLQTRVGNSPVSSIWHRCSNCR